MGQFLVLNIDIDSISIDYGQVFIRNGHLIKKNLPLKFGVFLAFFPVFLISMTLALYSVLIRDYFMLKLTETYPIMFLESVSFSLMAIFKKKFFVISRDMLTQNRQCDGQSLL